MIWNVFKTELFKIYRRPRTFISFAVVLVISVLIQIAFKANGKEYAQLVTSQISEIFDINDDVFAAMLNGYLICYILLQSLLINIPLLIALVGADMIAGEANMGTLRLLQSKPVSRFEMVMGKFLATFVYTMLLLIFLAICALFVSMIMFGTGDVFNAKSSTLEIVREKYVFTRYIYAFLFAALAMTTVAALSFFLSVFGENSIGPMVASMGIIIVCTIIGTLDDIPLFAAIKKFLFTSHMLGWKGFFDEEVPWAAIRKSVMVLATHIVLFLGLTVFVYKRKDILS
jgi:ABC-2 type transport system permease protein